MLNHPIRSLFREQIEICRDDMNYKRLYEICVNLDSKRKPITAKDRAEGGIPYYGASGVVDYVEDYIFDEDLLLVSEDGANLVMRSTPIAFSIKGKTWVNNHAHVLKFQDAYLQQYVELYLNSIDLTQYITGTAQPKLNQQMLNTIPIPIPDETDIQRIVSTLNTLRGIIRLRERQLQVFDEFIKARFVEMFGEPIDNPMNWPVKRLKELSSLITNGNTPKGGSDNYIDQGIVFLRSQNVWRNRIDLSDVAYIDEDTHAKLKKSSVHHNDILITKTGRINTENSSLGRAALYTGEDNSANINGHVYLIRLKNGIDPRFVVTILTGEAYRKYIRKVCVGGIDKRQINLDQVEDFPIILPPLEQQIQFSKFVEQVDKSKVAVKKALDETKLLFDSLMQEYFG